MDMIAETAARIAGMTPNVGVWPVARASDTEDNGGLRFALDRVAAVAAEAGKVAADVKDNLTQHMLRCEAGNAAIARDVSDLRRDVCRAHEELAKNLGELKEFIGKIVRWGVFALILLFAITLLGLENALGLYKTITGLKP